MHPYFEAKLVNANSFVALENVSPPSYMLLFPGHGGKNRGTDLILFFG